MLLIDHLSPEDIERLLAAMSGEDALSSDDLATLEPLDTTDTREAINVLKRSALANLPSECTCRIVVGFKPLKSDLVEIKRVLKPGGTWEVKISKKRTCKAKRRSRWTPKTKASKESNKETTMDTVVKPVVKTRGRNGGRRATYWAVYLEEVLGYGTDLDALREKYPMASCQSTTELRATWGFGRAEALAKLEGGVK